MKSFHKRSEKGYTLIELMVTMAIISIVLCALLPLTLAAANFWCTEAGVEKQLKAQDSEVVEIISVNRGIVGSTIVVARTRGGAERDYCVDTNILFNYDIEPCSK